VIHDALLGRDRELTVVRRALRELVAGLPGDLAISGEPGIGKTRLLDEVVRLAVGHGCLVARAAAGELESRMPFAVIAHALDPLVARAGPELAAGLDRAELATVFPSSRSSAETKQPLMVPVERHLLFAAVRTAVGRLAVARPMLVILDDAHWADPASVELLHHLLRRPPPGRVTIVVAYRPRQAAPGLDAALDAGRRVARVPLAPLSDGDAERLLSGVSSRQRRQRLLRLADGNPLHLLTIARSGGGPLAILVRRDLGAVPAAARRVAAAAAVLGDAIRPTIVADLADLPVARVFAATDDLARRDLVRADTSTGVIRFRHPLVRHEVYRSLPPGERLRLHARAATVLAAHGMPATERAEHVQRSAAPGDTAAAMLLADAAAGSVARAPASAAHWYAAALRLLPDDTDPTGPRLTWMVAQADALAAAGQIAEACDLLRAARDQPGASEPAVDAGLVAAIGAGYNLLGRHDLAADLASRALDALPDGHSTESAALTVQLAHVAFWRRDFAAMRRHAGHGYTAAQAAGSQPLAVDAAAHQAFAEFQLGALDDAARLLAAAAATADATGDAAMAVHLQALSHLGHVENVLGRHDDAYRHLSRAYTLARDTRQGHLMPMLRCNLTLSLLHHGRLDEAETHAQAALDQATTLGNDLLRTMALLGCAWSARDRGDPGRAVRFAEQALAAGRQIGPMPTGFAGLLLAEATYDLGRPDRAIGSLLAAAGDDLAPIEPTVRPRAYELLVRAELDLGDIASARRYASSAGACPVAGFPRGRVYAERARAALLIADDRHNAAVAAAEAALDAAIVARAPLEAARSRLILGRALAASGDRRAAVRTHTRAEAELAALGANSDRDRAASALRALGAPTPRPRTPIGARSGLSTREHQVANLVAAGRTNRQIAAQLHITENTVETHLRRIFAKLSVSSRAAISPRLEERSTR
jgi:ATP/maltotriose-dependent transcriptional regulator MalT